MRYAAKLDSTHKRIKQVYQNCFWQVWDTSRAGDSFPDLVMIRRGEVRFVECKTGNKPLRPGQKKFFDMFGSEMCRKIGSIDEAILDAIK
jgi:hypothetical protein